MPKSTRHTPTVFQALLPILTLIGLIALNVLLLGDDTLSGANQLSLLTASAVAVAVAVYNGVSWEKIMNGIKHTLTMAIPAILILLMIGVLAGAWMVSGIIPAMIHYGLNILQPDYFLPAAVIISAVISVATGSSWSTIATVGVALLGIGQTLGFNEAMVAGAIISGAYFGDKVSPLSDTTNLAAATSGVDLFTHIRYMMQTTIPTLLITLLLFAVISLSTEVSDQSTSVGAVQEAITGHYNISLWLFVVPIAVVVMIVRKMPPIPVLFLGGIMGSVLALVAQPEVLSALAGESSLTAGGAYTVLTKAMYGTTTLNSGNEVVDSLFVSRGMAGMLNTVWLIVCAMIFGGVMEAGHFLERITRALMSRVNSTGGLVTTTAATCVLFNTTASDQYISIVVPGKMFANAYERKRLAPELLSRTLEDAGTATSVLIPWNTCGATQAGVLGVATLTYLPFAFFCYLSPLMSLLFAWTGFKIRKINEIDHTVENQK